jgi:hypothetical protein
MAFSNAEIIKGWMVYYGQESKRKQKKKKAVVA